MLVSSVGLGQNLGLPVVAKGVETQAEWDLVGSLGVDVVQGILSPIRMPGDAPNDWSEKWNAESV